MLKIGIPKINLSYDSTSVHQLLIDLSQSVIISSNNFFSTLDLNVIDINWYKNIIFLLKATITLEFSRVVFFS